ncbi:MAG: hypothetical protein L7F78_22045 [Syntrophales bacterium LBB04]|nr:hypothetical protein [Syntrophales bacterium LBB04]
MAEGTYNLVPSKAGYSFNPPYITLEVNTSQKYQLFVAEDASEQARKPDRSRRRH